MNKLLALVLVLGTAMAFSPKAGAAQCPDCGLLKGTYNFNLTGEAAIASTSGYCSQNAGSNVAAAFTSGELDFDGHGNILPGGQSGVLSMGATSCALFGIVGGSYSIEDRGNGTFEATGVMDFASANHNAPCRESSGDLALGSQPFVITGLIGGKILLIRTYGSDAGVATYAEGTGGQTTCSALIMNFITKGTVDKY